MRVIAIGRFMQTCLGLLEDVRRTGKPLLVTKRGVPVAVVSPPPPERRLDWGSEMRGSAEVVGDLVAPAVEPEEWEVLRDEAAARHARLDLEAPRTRKGVRARHGGVDRRSP